MALPAFEIAREAETWPEFDQEAVECNANGTEILGRKPYKALKAPGLWLGAVAGAVISIAALSYLKAKL